MLQALLQVRWLWKSCKTLWITCKTLFLGTLELLDVNTDGQQIAVAKLCDDSFHDKWVGSFEVSDHAMWINPHLAWIVDHVHMYGFYIFVMTISSLVPALLSASFVFDLRMVIDAIPGTDMEVAAGLAAVTGWGALASTENGPLYKGCLLYTSPSPRD